MKPTAAAIIATLACSLPAGAADWHIVPDESTLGIIGHQNDVAFVGEFLAFDAAITFDPDDPGAATIDVEIDMASLETDNPQRDEIVRGVDLFNVADHPTAQFTANGFTVEGDRHYGTVGELTIRGVTHEVALPFSLAIDGDRAHAVGEMVINRLDFNVGEGRWASEQPVAYEVTITIDIVAQASN